MHTDSNKQIHCKNTLMKHWAKLNTNWIFGIKRKELLFMFYLDVMMVVIFLKKGIPVEIHTKVFG